MNASKENCQKAINDLNAGAAKHGIRFDFVNALLEAALRRLPSEAAIAKDKTRKKKLAKIA